MALKLENKVAWVSGANKGIGAGIARLFAAEGAKVAMIGRTPAEGEAIAQEIRQAGAKLFSSVATCLRKRISKRPSRRPQNVMAPLIF